METDDGMHVRTVGMANVSDVWQPYRSDRPDFKSSPVGYDIGDTITIADTVYDPFTGKKLAEKGDVGVVISGGTVVQIRLQR